MIKLGVNTVLFSNHDLETAMRHIAYAGYDGVELSAIKGMCEHLELDNWRAQAASIKQLSHDLNLALLSMEEAALDEDRLTKAFEAAQEIGIPIINIGPGGKMNEPETLKQQVDLMARMAEKAAACGVTLCVKAHVGACIWNTETTLHAIKQIANPAFGIDMDPSHIWRAGENPEDALPPVLSRTRHIHIRDCKGRQQGPGAPELQACGRGDINLPGYFKAMVAGGYSGPVCLEVIGAAALTLAQKAIIAAESYGYMNAILKTLHAR
ncbi:MAG: sugar phosphate isomerase/epimerase [Candidatus Sumerlaeota bacterium]|nr:sugar phosphate isomerase/epimerase [Candidatus Sumerlaeota bacterium]